MPQSLYVSVSSLSQPGQRKRALEVAGEIERRGFEGIFCAQSGAGMALCHSLAHTTSRLRFGTGIVNIYGRNPVELCQSACYLHEVSGGRFILGLGVSHQPFNEALAVETGKPVPDMRRYVERMREAAPQNGSLPPIYLAALRRRMTKLAADVSEGALFANLPLSRVSDVIAPIPTERRSDGFWLGNTLTVCLSDDRRAAVAAVKQRMTTYLSLPYYLNFWREAGYGEEMDRFERTRQESGPGAALEAIDEGWLDDVAIIGSARQVRDKIEAWQAAGVTPVLGPVGTSGDAFAAFAGLLDALK
jgi:alkanesulfonate monooxygenase SsuD/methylene tetrahydromethanopterin reductase-like flavin-dependent oxidoreductase (luciferase family)